ncbi:hypothetical protein BDZ91DRAFT_800914 [Kalaharituber pfeilii]|nr:hypothetical protein BDZ91DRAFT_800914 [Kalaharituber pfeilii]
MSSVPRLRSIKSTERNAHYSYDQLQQQSETDIAPAQSTDNNVTDVDSGSITLQARPPSSKGSSTYPGVTFRTVIFHTWPIILFNFLCEILFAYTLKRYGVKRVLNTVERRVFNALVIFLAAAISTGIGFLIDQVGYMLRGGLLMKGFNTKQEIAYIWQGTLGSYALLVWSHLRRKSYNIATTLALLFLIVNVVGRLSVALFGFTYTLDFTDQIEVPALRVVQWPEAGELISGEIDIHSNNASGATLLEILRSAATGMTSLTLSKANGTHSQEPIINPHKVLNIPDLILSIADDGIHSTVSYSYRLKDEGGDELMKENRTIKTVVKCTHLNNSSDLSEFPSTFYPIRAMANVQWVAGNTTVSIYTSLDNAILDTVTTYKAFATLASVSESERHSTDVVTNRILTDTAFTTVQVSENEDHSAQTVANGIPAESDVITTPVTITSTEEMPILLSTNLPTIIPRRGLVVENTECPIHHGSIAELVGWMMFAYPHNTVDCGVACTNLVLSAGNATYGVSTFNEYGVKYQCQITVNYEAAAPWAKGDQVAPGEALRRTLSGFLVGDETRRDMDNPVREFFTYGRDKLWLPSWEDDRLEEPLPTVMIAGALARAIAVVVRRMDDGLRTIEIMPPKISVVAVLSVQWQRILFILGGIAGFQILVAVVAGWFVRAKLEVEYDVDLVSRILKNENFQAEEEYGCPWQVVQMYEETPIYRFTGVIKNK